MRKIFSAKIYHRRDRPKKNEFTYSGYYIRVDIDQLDGASSRFFKINKFGLFSFYEKDHGRRDGSSLREWAVDKLEKSGIYGTERIELQTFPRVLGYVFNPVSFWFCYKGNDLIAIINEVNNTFGQSHTYIINKKKQELPKNFHVSPFFDVKGYYKFDFTTHNTARIDYYDSENLELKTLISGKELESSDKTLIKLFVTRPLYTFLVVGLIHYQALKLFIKKTSFYSLPEQPIEEITYEYKH